MQWRNQRGSLGVQPPPFASKPVFFHSRKVTVIKYYSLSLTTRKTINSHDLRKTNHLGSLLWSLLSTNILTYERTAVHFMHCCSFSTSNKITSKGCQSASQTCDFDAKIQKKIWGGEGDTPSPHPTPRRLRRLDLNPLHSEILPTLLKSAN